MKYSISLNFKYLSMKIFGKNTVSIEKNEILNPLGIPCLTENVWSKERLCWLNYILK